jgi:hypothetical protein
MLGDEAHDPRSKESPRNSNLRCYEHQTQYHFRNFIIRGSQPKSKLEEKNDFLS